MNSWSSGHMVYGMLFQLIIKDVALVQSQVWEEFSQCKGLICSGNHGLQNQQWLENSMFSLEDNVPPLSVDK